MIGSRSYRSSSTPRALEEYRAFAKKRGVTLPDEFEAGGIVGMATLKDCVAKSPSKWFEGPVGWQLEKPRRLKFIKLKGRLGIFDPPKAVRKTLAGKPVVRGTRLAVEFVLDLLAAGEQEADILANYPGLTHDDILACLAYASHLAHEYKAYPLPV
jgi:uncharacterized protein (DUF433 family)